MQHVIRVRFEITDRHLSLLKAHQTGKPVSRRRRAKVRDLRLWIETQVATQLEGLSKSEELL